MSMNMNLYLHYNFNMSGKDEPKTIQVIIIKLINRNSRLRYIYPTFNNITIYGSFVESLTEGGNTHKQYIKYANNQIIYE